MGRLSRARVSAIAWAAVKGCTRSGKLSHRDIEDASAASGAAASQYRTSRGDGEPRPVNLSIPIGSHEPLSKDAWGTAQRPSAGRFGGIGGPQQNMSRSRPGLSLPRQKTRPMSDSARTWEGTANRSARGRLNIRALSSVQ